MLSIGPAGIVLVGYSRAVLDALAGHVPPGAVLVVEDPRVAVNRAVPEAARADPLIGGLVLAEYHRAAEVDRLRATIPELRAGQAVVPGVEYAVEAAARLAVGLNLPGAGLIAAAVFRDKARQRQLAGACAIVNPRYTVARSESDVIAFVQAVGGRCIVKPTARQASAGVRFVHADDPPAELGGAYRSALSAGEARLMPAQGLQSGVIVEEAVTGREYSVEMLISEGRPCFSNVTAKHLAAGEHPVETGHLVPGSDDTALMTELVSATANLLAAARFGDGVAHCEWIASPAGPVLVECAARIPGDNITTLLTLAYDAPFIPAYVRVLLGDDPQYPQKPAYGSAIRFLTAPPGSVMDVRGVAAAAGAAGVQQVQVTVASGDVVQPLTSSWNRAGYVLTRSATAAHAMRAADAAAALIDISVRPTATS